MASLVDNCVFVATSSGTGVFVVSAALQGYQTPAQTGQVVDTTKTYRYRAQSTDLSQWEQGNTVSSSTQTSFTRVVTKSSAGGTTTVSFTNPPNVALTMVAADVLQFDDAMSLTDAQKAQARTNLYAAPFDALAYNGMQTNGLCDVSQELSTNVTLVSGTAKYIIDSWQQQYVHGAGTAVFSCGQLNLVVGGIPLSGYTNGTNLTCSTALSSPANGDYALHRQSFEGYRIARLGWGAAGAQPIAWGVWVFSGTVGGTAFIKWSNSNKTRCYYQEVAVAAGGWTYVSGTLPGDTSGTWNSGNGVGLIFEFFAAGKAASIATTGAWSSTNTTQTTNNTNLCSANGNSVILTGFLVLPGIELPSQSRAPLIMRPFDQEITLCQRYMYVWNYWGYSSEPVGIGHAYTAGTSTVQYKLPVKMRAQPTWSFSSLAHFIQLSNGTNGAPTAMAADVSGFEFMSITFTGGATIAAASSAYVRASSGSARMYHDARM